VLRRPIAWEAPPSAVEAEPEASALEPTAVALDCWALALLPSAVALAWVALAELPTAVEPAPLAEAFVPQASDAVAEAWAEVLPLASTQTSPTFLLAWGARLAAATCCPGGCGEDPPRPGTWGCCAVAPKAATAPLKTTACNNRTPFPFPFALANSDATVT
jgi:hypothetical protein